MSSIAWSPRCFLALPRGEDFDGLYQELDRQLNSLDINVISSRRDEGYESARSVEDAVQGADLMIADITGGRPNVMFEVGLAAGMRKPILIVNRYGSDPPLDLHSYRVISYQPGDRRLHTYVESWVRDAISSPRSVA
jgi:hypothetical protein